VTYEQPATPLEHRHHPRDDVALGRLVEVDQHVAQEDEIERADRPQPGVEIDLLEADLAAQSVLDQGVESVVGRGSTFTVTYPMSYERPVRPRDG
jgi:hypothetical protein